MRYPHAILAMLWTLAGACAPCSDPTPSEPPSEPKPAVEARPDQPAVVVFVVLDTVRADHTSLCGYNRRTTPVLERLVQRGATSTCRAYSPAPWTLPSHATYFTGVPVTDHGAMFVASSDIEISKGIRARPLSPSYETLAETFKGRGFQTAAVSANVILTEASGVLQGFDHVTVSPKMVGLRKARLGKEIDRVLAGLSPDQPLFLFVNIYDAHDPYPPVGEALGWGPAQPGIPLDPYTASDKNPFYTFLRDTMPADQQDAWLDRLTKGYDAGILNADRNLGRVMTALRDAGWLERGYRLVVTSDHGEFLGEHQMLRHSGFLWEPAVRVPLLAHATAGPELPKHLPEPFSALHAYHLVKDGVLPNDLSPPHTVSEKNPASLWVGHVAGAIWQGRDKLTCIDGEKGRYHLPSDPGEQNPVPIGDHPGAARLDALCAGIDALHQRPPPSDDAELLEALRSVGYVE